MPRNIPVFLIIWYLSVEPLDLLSQIFILLLRVNNSLFHTRVPKSRSPKLWWWSIIITGPQYGTSLMSPFRCLQYSDVFWIIATFVHLCVTIRKTDTPVSLQINYVLTCNFQVHWTVIKRLHLKERL